jgi:hypothetical protein
MSALISVPGFEFSVCKLFQFRIRVTRNSVNANVLIEWGETECTSETGRGQFSIFGAIEEMAGLDFRG